ncbi:MAG: type II toxin-antitoxin system Phd/YefM family antitoxin [Candidatus Rokubacteria bacterium]|nr:type II toxin-antitoxin system Phd/YefM family antitoxin [Candidatus Rokubacteria bacterium]
MVKTLPITKARAQLLDLAEELSRKPEAGAVAVTKRGQPVLALMPWEFYESIVETLEILGDEALMASLRQSIKEAGKGKTISWKDVKKSLSL